MSYKVIHYFTDLQDFNHPYKVGDSFPRLGLKVSEDRLKELASKNNKQGKPLIELAQDEVDLCDLPFVDVPNETPYTKTEINRMSTSDLRELAVVQGIDNADEFTGAELKKMLIEKMCL